MSLESWFGLLASACSMTSFVPQTLKVWKDHKTSGLSRPMYVLTATGFAFWTAYGLARGDLPVIATNSVCFVLSVAILLKLLIARGGRDAPDSR